MNADKYVKKLITITLLELMLEYKKDLKKVGSIIASITVDEVENLFPYFDDMIFYAPIVEKRRREWLTKFTHAFLLQMLNKYENKPASYFELLYGFLYQMSKELKVNLQQNELRELIRYEKRLIKQKTPKKKKK